jgi:hypothetical protein
LADAATRRPLFLAEEVPGIRGLGSLTEPATDLPGDEAVAAVVDVAVIGARGDGKTQFIVHAIRTLRAYAPHLTGAEHQYNREIMQVVMNARTPRPDATAPGVIPHYVFRIRPDALLGQLGGGARAGLLRRAAGLGGHAALAAGNAAALGGAVWGLGHGTAVAGAAVAGAAAVGGALAMALSRRRFARTGEIEIVFWDVAGEHVYAQSSADYYSFLSALVRERRRVSGRGYAFAPVLVCNPLALGTHREGSSYARLKQLMPLFASIDPRTARAMVAINRWSVVDAVCAPDSDREEVVALAPTPRPDERDDERDDRREEVADAADAATMALPVVKRDVVRQHCRDAEDGKDGDVRVTYLRYDAGVQCEFHARPWDEWKNRAETGRWRPPTRSTPEQAIDYVYAEGPGAFVGEARQVLLGWLADLAYGAAAQPRLARVPAATTPPPAADDAPTVPMATPTPSMPMAPAPDSDVVLLTRKAEPLASGRATPVGEVWQRPGGFGTGGT